MDFLLPASSRRPLTLLDILLFLAVVFVLLAFLGSGPARAAEAPPRYFLTEAAEDIKSNSKLEFLDKTTPAVFQDFTRGEMGFGTLTPLVRYRSFEATLGIVAPTESFAGSLTLGPALQLGDEVQAGLFWAIDRVPFLKDRLGLLKRNQKYVSLGVAAGYDFRPARWAPRVFAGLRVPL